MGIRGPQPKPTALKMLNGNPGNRPLNHAEPKPTPITEVSAPTHFSNDQKLIWGAITKELARLGLLTVLDLEGLSRWVDYLFEYRTALRELQGRLLITYYEGEGENRKVKYIQQNPYLAIKNNAADKLLKLEQQFGMSPAARARMIAMLDGWKGGGDGDDKDPYAA